MKFSIENLSFAKQQNIAIYLTKNARNENL